MPHISNPQIIAHMSLQVLDSDFDEQTHVADFETKNTRQSVQLS